MKVAIVGSRNAEDMDVAAIIRRIPLTCSQIISGGAPGIDTLAEQAAQALGISCVCHRPDYHRYGKYAPLRRNDRIIDEADLILAFWDFHSRGTSYVIAQCIRRGKPIKVFDVHR